MHEGHRSRMRKKYIEYGADVFAAHEMLEMLLFYAKKREDTNALAHCLIDTFGSFDGVLDADIKDLMNVKGVGEQTAVLIKLTKDLSEYYHKAKWRDARTLLNVEETGYYLVDMIGAKPYESLYILCLENANKILIFQEVERGCVSSATVNIRKVVEIAIRNNAAKVVIAHNHPSGIVSPSQQDIALTQVLKKAFTSIDIKMIDHIIVGGQGFTSLAKDGRI